MNPWHDVPIGVDPVHSFQCVIEIPRGSKNKYELDKETGILKVDQRGKSVLGKEGFFRKPFDRFCRLDE